MIMKENFYGQEYLHTKGWAATKFGAITKEDRLVLKGELGGLQKDDKVLEVGFGNGSCLSFLKEMNVKTIVGVEINELLLDSAKSSGFEVYQSLSDVTSLGERFSKIIAYDLIEHLTIDEIFSFFGFCRDNLCEDGEIHLRYPNGDSPFGRISQHGDITHLSTIGFGKMSNLADRFNFEILEYRSPRIPVFGLGFVKLFTRSINLILREIIKRAINFIYFGASDRPMDPQAYVILRLKSKN
jgi:hypothetical protein